MGGGVNPHLKKAGTDFVRFLVCFFGNQSTPLSAIRPLPVQFALFFPYLSTLYATAEKTRMEPSVGPTKQRVFHL